MDLSDLDALAEDPALQRVAAGVFAYARFLLDDDDNLTTLGNLAKPGRELLRARTLELLDGADADADDSDLDAALDDLGGAP